MSKQVNGLSGAEMALKTYIAGKVSIDSTFGTHDWRDAFCDKLEKLSDITLVNFDPTKTDIDQADPDTVFGCDAYMISQADVLICYFSDDISVGGSQEVLVAKYFNKPVIGFAPFGGKFNGSTKKYFDRTVKNYKDPFVFSTCDVVCATIEEVAAALRSLDSAKPKSMELIDDLAKKFANNHLKHNSYLKKLLEP